MFTVVLEDDRFPSSASCLTRWRTHRAAVGRLARLPRDRRSRWAVLAASARARGAARRDSTHERAARAEAEPRAARGRLAIRDQRLVDTSECDWAPPTRCHAHPVATRQGWREDLVCASAANSVVLFRGPMSRSAVSIRRPTPDGESRPKGTRRSIGAGPATLCPRHRHPQRQIVATPAREVEPTATSA
jgi:hypothetical protein